MANTRTDTKSGQEWLWPDNVQVANDKKLLSGTAKVEIKYYEGETDEKGKTDLKDRQNLVEFLEIGLNLLLPELARDLTFLKARDIQAQIYKVTENRFRYLTDQQLAYMCRELLFGNIHEWGEASDEITNYLVASSSYRWDDAGLVKLVPLGVYGNDGFRPRYCYVFNEEKGKYVWRRTRYENQIIQKTTGIGIGNACISFGSVDRDFTGSRFVGETGDNKSLLTKKIARKRWVLLGYWENMHLVAGFEVQNLNKWIRQIIRKEIESYPEKVTAEELSAFHH